MNVFNWEKKEKKLIFFGTIFQKKKKKAMIQMYHKSQRSYFNVMFASDVTFNPFVWF